jgi:mannose-6-phosphate isomerase-like protein (cupin superfamily)
MPDSQRKATFVRPGDGAHLAWFGDRVRYLAVGEQTDGRFSVAVETIPPGGGSLPHIRHREHVGYYVVSGELQFAVGNRSLTLSPGGFVCVTPSTAQKLVNSGHDDAELLVVSAPAGYDELRFRAGLPLPAGDQPTPVATHDDHETFAALAPGFGIELHPTSGFQHDPALRVTMPLEGKMTALVGDLYRFLAISEDTAGRFALFHALISPKGGPPFHIHSREDEAFFVLKGTVSFHADEASIELGPGGFVHLPIGTRHRFVNETNEIAEVLIIVAPAGFEKYIELAGQPWHDMSQRPALPDAAEIERLIANAPQYGIELIV